MLTWMRWDRYERRDAAVSEWDPATQEVFVFVRDELVQKLPSIRVEHIGSTSVPGLAGKGIVDVMVLPRTDEQTQDAERALQELGLNAARGSTRPRPFYLGAVAEDHTVTYVHVHVIHDGSDEATAQLGLARALREDHHLRQEYAAIKRNLVAHGTTDPVEYSMQKIHWVLATLERLGLPPLPDPGAPPTAST